MNQETKLVDFVCQGLSRHTRNKHLALFRRSLETCSEAFIVARMNATSDEEEQQAKMNFAEQVIEEYMGRLEDLKSSTIAGENKVRTKKNSEAGVNDRPRWKALLTNWMNPENLTDKTPEVPEFEDLVPA